MKTGRRSLPESFYTHIPKVNPQVNALPFYIKEVSYSGKHLLMKGSKNNYSDYLILYSLTDMVFIKNRVKSQIAENDIIFSSCNTPLRFVRKKMGGEYLYIIIGGTNAQFFYNHIRTRSGILHINPLSNTFDYFLSIINANKDTDDFLYQMEAGAMIHMLLLDLYRISKNILKTKSTTPVQDSAVQTAIRFIENNYNHNLTIDDICGSVSFSKYYFCKLFKESTGISLHRYVNEYRLNRSKELLSYTKLNIAAIANSVGFNNTLTFSRQFKEKYGMTPSEYREFY